MYQTFKPITFYDMTAEQSDRERQRIMDRIIDWFEGPKGPDIYEDDMNDLQDRVLWPVGMAMQ